MWWGNEKGAKRSGNFQRTHRCLMCGISTDLDKSRYQDQVKRNSGLIRDIILPISTFNCLLPLLKMHEGIVLDLLDPLHATEPNAEKSSRIKTKLSNASNLSNVSLKLSSVTDAVRFLQYKTFTLDMVSSSGSS